jgi:hypothetical protein
MTAPYRTPGPAPRDLLAECVERADRVKRLARDTAVGTYRDHTDAHALVDWFASETGALGLAVRLVDVVAAQREEIAELRRRLDALEMRGER